jgi:hypothetical protein
VSGRGAAPRRGTWRTAGLRLLVVATFVGACASPPIESPSPAASRASASAVATPSAGTTPGVPPSAVSSVVPSPDGQTTGVPSLLTVTCTPTGTEADAERVTIQPDGLHVHIRNTSGTERIFDIEGVGGDVAPSVEGLQVWRLPTGTARFSCGPSGTDPVQVEVVDPAGYYVSDAIDCPSAAVSNIDYAADASGPKGELGSVALSQIRGLRPGDRVEPAGYIRSLEPRVRVVSDGKVAAVAAYRSDGAGGWLVTSVSVCAGSGISWNP